MDGMNDHSHADMGMDMGAESLHRCQMSMLFTWSTKDLCLVFRWWHVSNTLTLILSLLAVAALGAGYELVRELSRRYEAKIDRELANEQESSSLLPGNRPSPASRKRSYHIGKSIFYAVQVFYSFFIMLLFMTYNGWVMIAVAVGAFFGHLVWGGNVPATKTVACH